MIEKPVIAFIATYDDVTDARQDYQEVKKAHEEGFIGEYDAAIVWRNGRGKLEIESVSEEASRMWLWAGLGVGALVGLIFPPSILATTAIGALSGSIIGKFRDGLPYDDLEQMGDALTGNNAALVVVARDRVLDALDTIGAKLDASNTYIEAPLSEDTAVAAQQLRAAIAQGSRQLKEIDRAEADIATNSSG